MTVGEFVRRELPGARLLAGERGLDRPVRGAVMIDLRRGRWSGRVGEASLCILPGWTEAEESAVLDVLIRRLASSGAAGLAIENVQRLPQAVVMLADRIGFPLVDLGETGVLAVVERLAVLQQEDRLQAYSRLDAAVTVLLEGRREGKPVESLLEQMGREIGGEAELVPLPARRSEAERVLPPDVTEAPDLVMGSVTLRVQGRGAYVLRLRSPMRPHQALVVRRLLAVAAALLEPLLEERHRKWESRLRSKSDLLGEILATSGQLAPEVVARAWQVGWNPSAVHVVAVLQIHDWDELLASRGWTEERMLEMQNRVLETLQGEVERAGLWVFSGLFQSHRFVLILRRPTAGDSIRPEAARAVLERAVRHVDRLGYGFRLDGAVSGPVVGWDGLRAGYQEAEEALPLVAAARGPGAVATVAELGPERWLEGWYRSPEGAAFAHQTLGPVLTLPDVRRRQLLETVEAFLRTRGDLSQAAKLLAIHRNTLRYRLKQFEALSGLSLERDFFVLEVATRVLRAQGR
ncbi:MAG: helix-turn-helix domain-containing protein [Clostridia bacterium]|nr:helix-turn-helix domain-containing protein [Clostridia bacterium]